MKNTFNLLFVCLLFAVNLCAQTDPARQWPSYRGYMASGVYEGANLPDTWDGAAGINVKWKTPLPGLGLSSPVIWNDKLFITTAVSLSDQNGLAPGVFGDVSSVADSSIHEWKVFCLNKITGEILWEKTACTGVPKIKRHPKSSHASASVATDGQYVVAFFGSEGLYCYDMDGNLKWTKNFGVLKSVFFMMENAEWEWSTSPIIHDGVVVIQCDVLKNSFLATYDVGTGNEIWKVDRDEYPGWCTPAIYESGGTTRIAVQGYKHRGGYDFKTGTEIWRMSGGGDIPIPTPILGNERIYFNSAHGPSSPILSVKTEAEGNITLEPGELTNEFIDWSIPRGASYMSTMVLYDNYLFLSQWNGNLQIHNAMNGAEVYKQPLVRGKSFTASPVAADGKVYCTDDDGIVYVVRAEPPFETIAENPLGSMCMTTPAISEGMIYFRTINGILAIGK